MFVRARKAKGRLYYQIVRGYRDDAGKVRQETIGLGHSPTVAAALEGERETLRRARYQRSRWKGFGNSDVAARQVARYEKTVTATEARIAKLEDAQRSGVS